MRIRATGTRCQRIHSRIFWGMRIAPPQTGFKVTSARQCNTLPHASRRYSMKARDIMTKNIECVTADDTAERAARIMRDEEVGIVPVVENQKSMKLSGVVTDRDITIRMVAEG